MIHALPRQGIPDTITRGSLTDEYTRAGHRAEHEEGRCTEPAALESAWIRVTRATPAGIDPVAFAHAPQLARAPARGTTPTRSFPRWALRVLRVPLVAKLVGANAILAAAGIAVAIAAAWGSVPAPILWPAIVLLALTVNVVLVVIALRPLRTLEVVAHRVWSGDFEARVPDSPLADPAVARVGRAFNVVLDALIADRARMRRLAAATIRAGDEERSRISAELHDSAAQSIAALTYQLSALARDGAGTPWAPRLEQMQESAAAVLEEVRLLAHVVHPRVLDDLGLAAALTQLARELQRTSTAEIVVQADADLARQLDTPQAAALYRIAREAIANAVRHAAANRIGVTFGPSDSGAPRLEIQDDGRGFRGAADERAQPGTGFFSMRERMSLVGGTLQVVSVANAGTRVVAMLPARCPAVTAVSEGEG